ncbi:TIGR03086 family metal-binding protein [Terrabacter terrigena]|uniref:TIGR03086 family metal-binding protein n=1 Tax=Terrabacter terrigena TaxID=574718 RepID=A0ABW3N2E4_9MICO
MSFTKTAHLPVTPDEAFALVTEPERLRRWQTVSAVVDLRAGGDYRWTVTPGHVAAGTFRELEPGRRVVFGWGWEGSDELPPDASTVTVTIEAAEGGSTVTLVHEGLSAEQAAMHAEGWNHYFDRLQRLAATGDAGRDDWSNVPAEMTPVTVAEAALAGLQPVLRALTDTDRSKQTPCDDFTCHELVEHLFASLEQLGAMAGTTVVNPEQGSLENRVSVMAAQAIDGWLSVDLEGTVPGPGGSEMPAAFAASILPVELALHGWDLAQASGQTLVLSDEVVAYLRTLAEGLVPAGRESGSFAAEVGAHDDASPLDRLAAFSGRTPLLAPSTI